MFLKILEGDEKAKNKFIELYREGLYRNVVVYSEVVRLSQARYRKEKLRKNPEFVKEAVKFDFAKIKRLLDLAQTLSIAPEVEKISAEIMNSYGLLPNDALIAATCKHFGIKKIATFDEDFKRVEFLEVVGI
ncbi:type II toxin-antitoxin system VapC family toxin [Archaeoglobus sp.]|uniref:type II toxin-antitoxin system VapC family toxin n=1 Tax=Archaeoglobus sp. TaxID=1872626 RepID=UPI00258B9198|nr:type II toxin-antitoxin system VapC family toxin [Archaeoglobus sp.]